MTVPAIGGTTAQGSTASTNDVLATLRNELLSYQPPRGDGTSLRDLIGESLFQVKAPDIARVKFPYGIMRLDTASDGRFHGMRLEGTLEVQLFGKPFTMQESVNDAADLCDQAMLDMVAIRDGLMFCRARTRQPLPSSGQLDAVDGEVCGVRLAYTVVIYPAFLTDLTRVLPPLE